MPQLSGTIGTDESFFAVMGRAERTHRKQRIDLYYLKPMLVIINSAEGCRDYISAESGFCPYEYGHALGEC